MSCCWWLNSSADPTSLIMKAAATRVARQHVVLHLLSADLQQLPICWWLRRRYPMSSSSLRVGSTADSAPPGLGIPDSTSAGADATPLAQLSVGAPAKSCWSMGADRAGALHIYCAGGILCRNKLITVHAHTCAAWPATGCVILVTMSAPTAEA